MRIPRAINELRQRKVLRLAGVLFGVGCFVGALYFAAREREEFAAALQALRDPPPLVVVAVLVSIALGAVLTAALFHILMRRYAAIPFAEMLALMTATACANYLPLKPGFVGRVAYHRIRHGIRATHTLRTIVEAIGLSGTVASLFLASLFVLRAIGIPGEFAMMAPSLLAIAGIAPRLRTLSLALLVRQAEFALLTFRYWAVFRLVGAPIDLDAAIVLASVNAIATLIPLVSNGLGVREWLTGLITPLVSPDTFAEGVIAELVHRVAEIAVITPLGILSIAGLARYVRKHPMTAVTDTP